MKKYFLRYRYTAILLRQLVISDFKLRYQGSFLGYIWSLLRPGAIFAILYVVFGLVIKVGADIPNYPIYLLLGIVLWTFFVEVTSGSVSSIVAKGDLMRKLSFPRYVIVVASSLSALINLALNLAVVLIFALVRGIHFQVSDLLIAPLILELYIFSLAVAFLLSSLYVRYRDISYIWEVFIQGAFYATPVIYSLSLVVSQSKLLAQIISLSPVTQVIQDARYLLVTDHTVTIRSLFDTWVQLVPLCITLVLFMIAGRYFRSRSRMFAEEV